MDPILKLVLAFLALRLVLPVFVLACHWGEKEEDQKDVVKVSCPEKVIAPHDTLWWLAK